MKKIGLVGGISWTSTVDYYRYINEGINAQLGGLNFAECLIYSINFYDFQKHNVAHNWDRAFELLSNAALQLKKAGAEAIVLGANTAHIVAERVEAAVGLPLIHIAEATGNEIRRQGLQTVGLLGTAFTMEQDFYKNKLKAQGIHPLIPARQQDRDFIQQTLLHELSKGIVKPGTKQAYLGVIDQLIAEGAEGIILGCTELPLIIVPEDVNVPVFDTTKIHSAAAVAFAIT